jgi:hypothetical protein
MDLMAYYGWQPAVIQAAAKTNLEALRERADKRLSLFDHADTKRYDWRTVNRDQRYDFQKEWRAKRTKQRNERIAELVVQAEAFLRRHETASMEAIANKLKAPPKLMRYVMRKIPDVKLVRKKENGRKICMWRLEK